MAVSSRNHPSPFDRSLGRMVSLLCCTHWTIPMVALE
jgi:hypothetical protein